MANKKTQLDSKTEKKLKKEIKQIKTNPKKKKEIVRKVTLTKEEYDKYKTLTKPYLINKEKLQERRKNKTLSVIALILLFMFLMVMLILLCNRTFFMRKYKTSKINIDIPLMMFFKKDDGNKIVLKTLRKTKYLENYFDDKLRNYTKYTCNGYSFYYDDLYSTAIYSVDIEKNVAIKTVTIEYASGDADCLCNVNKIGKEAEELCSK